MNIGSAIRLLRKEKSISQKELAQRCDISVNALCQIETNASFPQKATIQKICDALSVPVSYLLFFSINEEDIPEDKRKVFKSLNSAVKGLLLDGI